MDVYQITVYALLISVFLFIVYSVIIFIRPKTKKNLVSAVEDQPSSDTDKMNIPSALMIMGAVVVAGIQLALLINSELALEGNAFIKTIKWLKIYSWISYIGLVTFMFGTILTIEKMKFE